MYNLRCFVGMTSVCAQHVPYFSRTLNRKAKKNHTGDGWLLKYPKFDHEFYKGDETQ